ALRPDPTTAGRGVTAIGPGRDRVIDRDQLRRAVDIAHPPVFERDVVVAIAGPDIRNAPLRHGGGRIRPTGTGAPLPVVDVTQLRIAGAGEDVDVLGIRHQQVPDPATEVAPVFHVLAAAPVGVSTRRRLRVALVIV